MRFARVPKTQNGNNDTVRRLKVSIRRQILLAVSALALIAVLAFAMAVAWYTNVTKTSGIQFKTEVWGFAPENITIGDPSAGEDAAYSISPGKTGFVPLSIDNSMNAADISAVVNVFKSGMSEALQQRIYFYVDAPKTVSYSLPGSDPAASVTETSSRTWLGSRRSDSYTYSVLAGEKLTLDEVYRSDAALKWLWVNDLEGYYFRGTVTAAGAEVEEYLRPVEYALTGAGFDEETKALVSVDGIPLEDYLAALLASDGYAGRELGPGDAVAVTETPEGETPKTRLYYRIDADGEGTGIWLYLLDLDEIDAASAYDSLLPPDTPIAATVSVTVFSNSLPTVEAASAEALTEALAQPGAACIRLTGDVSALETLTPAGDKTIDLNNYNLSYTGSEESYQAFTVPEGSSLTLLNGTLVGNSEVNGGEDTLSAAVVVTGGTATLSGISVENYDTAVKVDDRNGTGDSVTKLVNCHFETNATTLYLFGNGSNSEGVTRLIVENSTIASSEYVGILGNGTAAGEMQSWGTELIVLNSDISGHWAAIYQPQQQARTVITGSTLTGYTGIAVKGGTVDLYGCTVTGTGAKKSPAAGSSGWTDTGDAVYVEAVYGWSASVFVRGTENELNSDHGYLLQLFGVEGKGPGKIVSEAGPYSGSEVNWNRIGEFAVMTAEESGG